MSQRLLTLLLALAVVPVFGCSKSSESSRWVHAGLVDLGEVESDRTIARLAIQNKMDRPWRIRDLSLLCAPATPVLAKNLVEPGEDALLDLEILGAEYPGMHRHSGELILEDDSRVTFEVAWRSRGLPFADPPAVTAVHAADDVLRAEFSVCAPLVAGCPVPDLGLADVVGIAIVELGEPELDRLDKNCEIIRRSVRVELPQDSLLPWAPTDVRISFVDAAVPGTPPVVARVLRPPVQVGANPAILLLRDEKGSSGRIRCSREEPLRDDLIMVSPVDFGRVEVTGPSMIEFHWTGSSRAGEVRLRQDTSSMAIPVVVLSMQD